MTTAGAGPQRLIIPRMTNPRKKTSSAKGVQIASARKLKITIGPGNSNSPGSSGGARISQPSAVTAIA